MLLYCPQCNTGYAVDPNVIPEKGIKMRCAKCGKIWRCTKDDLKEEPDKEEAIVQESAASTTKDTPDEQINPQSENDSSDSQNTEEKSVTNAEMQDIFARLSTQTQDLFQKEQTRPVHQKLWSSFKHISGVEHPGTLKYYLLGILVLVGLFLISIRYEVVRQFPAAEKFYTALGIESRVIGEGLEFQNVVRNEYEEDYIRKLEIKGYIVNTNKQKVTLPLIHVEVMDKDTNILQAINDKAPIAELEPNEKQMFRIVITQPSSLSKYILLTFKSEK